MAKHKEEKTNVMRALEQKKIAYTAHSYDPDGPIDGVSVAAALGPVLGRLGIPAETLPLMLVRPFSGSAALGVGAELIQTYGPDSPVGRTAAVMLGGTETTFYTVAVYFGAAGVRRSRYALPAALTADFVGFLAAALAVRLFF